jgi:hypothetical protein
MTRKKVLVLGGNFGGLTAALAVQHELHGDVDVRAFAYETVRLLEGGSTLEAFANAAASTAPGLLAAGAGLALAAVL